MLMGRAKTESLKGEAWARESRSSYSTLVSRRWQSNGASASVFGVGASSIVNSYHAVSSWPMVSGARGLRSHHASARWPGVA